MKRGRTPLPMSESVKRHLADIRLAASTSFTEEEVQGLDELFAALRRGADVRLIVRSAPMLNVQRKIESMKMTVERQRERRALKGRSE